MHVWRACGVRYFVSFARLWIGLLGLSAWAADASLDATLAGVEARYNRARTLQVLFQEQYTPPGRPRRTEAGTLQLRKPGRMRRDYSQPKGKLFISDGKALWLYTPSDNRAARMKLQESEDMRAPLAFLLGKLNFQKEFRNLAGIPKETPRASPPNPKATACPMRRWSSWWASRAAFAR